MKTLIKNAKVYKGGEIITADILTEGGIIAAVGQNINACDITETVNASGYLVMPAFINTHTHSYMSIYRGAADDLPFTEWLFGRVMPMEDRTVAEQAYWGSMLAVTEMIKTGTGSFCDMYIFTGVSPLACRDSGLRGVLGRGLVGTEAEPGDRLEAAVAEYLEFKDEPRVKFTVAPHAIYTTDAHFLHRCMDAATKYGLPIHTHLSESIAEIENCRRDHGVSPVEYLDRLGMFDIKTLAAHCVQMSDDDIAILAERGVSVASCPKSNLKLGNGFARLDDMLKRGVNVTIGTDSASSNNSLDMFSEINYAALLQKGLTHDAAAFGAKTVIDCATVNAAKALGLNNGEIAAGKYADIMLVDLSNIAFTPDTDIVSSLVYAANGSCVDSLMVDGRWLMRHREMLSVDEEKIKYNCNKIAERLVK